MKEYKTSSSKRCLIFQPKSWFSCLWILMSKYLEVILNDLIISMTLLLSASLVISDALLYVFPVKNISNANSRFSILYSTIRQMCIQNVKSQCVKSYLGTFSAPKLYCILQGIFLAWRSPARWCTRWSVRTAPLSKNATSSTRPVSRQVLWGVTRTLCDLHSKPLCG